MPTPRRRPGADDEQAARRTRDAPEPATPRVRPRGDRQSELQLSDEELRALADEGIDPADVTRLARERPEAEASDHDRGSARDDLEGLVAEHEGDY